MKLQEIIQSRKKQSTFLAKKKKFVYFAFVYFAKKLLQIIKQKYEKCFRKKILHIFKTQFNQVKQDKCQCGRFKKAEELIEKDEKSFFKLKIIKNYLRSIITQNGLCELAMIGIGLKLYSKIYFEEIKKKKNNVEKTFFLLLLQGLLFFYLFIKYDLNYFTNF